MKYNITKKAVSLWAACAALTVAAGATGIEGSPLGLGLKKMVADVSSFLIVLCPLIGGVTAVYFLIRRSMADEQDGKMWMHRVVVAVVCGVAGALVGGVIALVSSYF